MASTETKSVLFHTKALAGEDIPLAYPLIQATCPDVDLACWQAYANFFAERENSGVIALRDTVNCICGVVAYQLDRDLNAGLILAVNFFATADMMSSPRTVQALLDAAEARARMLCCDRLQIRLSGNQARLGSWLSALGLSSGAGLFWKKVRVPTPVN